MAVAVIATQAMTGAIRAIPVGRRRHLQTAPRNWALWPAPRSDAIVRSDPPAHVPARLPGRSLERHDPDLQNPENPLPCDPIQLLKTWDFVLTARARLKMCARDLKELGHEM